ncbi:tetratricopeptide repeat protein [Tenacibaculum sp. M341]|nr:tetratricopeptide repeat protein [Tenacibaculum sp. M341]
MCKYYFFILLMNTVVLFSQQIDIDLLQLEKAYKIAKTDSLKVEALLSLGEYHKKRDFNKVKNYYNEIEKILERVIYDYRKQQASSLHQIGIYKRRTSNYTGALTDYLRAKKIYVSLKDSFGLAQSYHNIAMIYRYQKEYDKSVKNFKKAVELNLLFKNYKSLGNNYSMMSGSYKQARKLDSAYYVIDKAILYYDLSNYKEGKEQAISNKATLLVVEGRHKEALPILLKYLDYVRKIKKKLSVISTLTNLANSYLHLKEYEKALIYVNESIEIATKENAKKKIFDGYLIRSRIYKAMNKDDLALKDVLEYSKINQEIFNVKNAKKLREIEVKYQLEQQRLKDSIVHLEEKKRLSIEAKNKVLQRQLYATILFTVLLILVLFIIFGYKRFQKETKLHEHKTTELSGKINTLNEEVVDVQKEVKVLRDETINHLEKKEKITKDLAKLSQKDKSISLQNIVNELKSDELEADRIDVLKTNISTLNKEYLERLKKKHPELTKTDIEVCSFIKIGLSRKEIANLRNTSLEAVKSTRFRLKKKLNLTKEDSLDVYLLNM